MPPLPPTILLTFDIEDWFQVENLRPRFPLETWGQQMLRVEKNTHKLLDLLDSILLSYDATTPRATFFILGWVAKRLPNLVREIYARGHELASHGFNHLMCNRMEPKDLEQDLTQSKKIIEDIAGVEVRGYRAPSFSINSTAIEIIRKSGYSYDSSYNNFSHHGRYGTISLNGYRKQGVAIRINHDFMELPISNLIIANQVIPWGGGGYFRFLPLPIFKSGVRRILTRSGAYIFYMHPWEIDPHQPRLKESGSLSSWRHYLNLSKTHQRLLSFITEFKNCKFQSCIQYLDAIDVQSSK